MSNKVKNILKMNGISSLPLFTEKSYGGRYLMTFDFNWIVPMPASLKLKPGSVEKLALEAAFRKDAVLRFQFGRNRTAMGEQEYCERPAMCEKTSAELASSSSE